MVSSGAVCSPLGQASPSNATDTTHIFPDNSCVLLELLYFHVLLLCGLQIIVNKYEVAIEVSDCQTAVLVVTFSVMSSVS